MKALLIAAAIILSASPAFADLHKDPEQYDYELKPAISSEDVVIQNMAKTTDGFSKAIYPKAEPTPVLGPTKAADLLDVDSIVAKKAAQKKVMRDYNKKMDLAYKSIPNKPSMWRHPMQRGDLWIDYHQDRFRKFRTRDLPVSQMGSTVLGTIFSAVAAFH